MVLSTDIKRLQMLEEEGRHTEEIGVEMRYVAERGLALRPARNNCMDRDVALYKAGGVAVRTLTEVQENAVF